MALSRDEINDIATKTAQEVINKLNRYTLVYQDPETLEQGLSQSMGEELTAANWYRARAKNARENNDNTTAARYEHIASEEDGHYREFGKRLAEMS